MAKQSTAQKKDKKETEKKLDYPSQKMNSNTVPKDCTLAMGKNVTAEWKMALGPEN